MPFGYAAAAAGTIGASLIGANATGKAANQQAGAEEQALQLQQQIFGTTQQNVQPYVASGQNALQSLNQLLGLNPGGAGPIASNPILSMLGIGGPGPLGSINPSTFTGSPGYQYDLQQQQQAIQNKSTTNGGVGGNALLALQQNAHGLANQNWNQYLGNSSNAWQQLLQSIGGQAGQGLSAAGTLAGLNQSNVNSQSGILGSIGNAQSAGTIGQANALTGGLNSLLGIGGTAGLTGGNNALTGIYNALYNPVTSLGVYGNTGAAGSSPGFFGLGSGIPSLNAGS